MALAAISMTKVVGPIMTLSLELSRHEHHLFHVPAQRNCFVRPALQPNDVPHHWIGAAPASDERLVPLRPPARAMAGAAPRPGGGGVGSNQLGGWASAAGRSTAQGTVLRLRELRPLRHAPSVSGIMRGFAHGPARRWC